MKTYELYKEVNKNKEGYTPFTIRYVAEPDPKREGLYKMSTFQSTDGYKTKYSYLYGKKNQAAIKKWIELMREVV